MALKPKALRVNAEMTREDLCKRFNDMGIIMTLRMLVDRENGITKWTGVEVVALTKIFDVEAKELDI